MNDIDDLFKTLSSYSRHSNYNDIVHDLQIKIIKEKNPEHIYLFAKYVKGVNIKELEDAILSTNNPEFIYLFARDIKDANIDMDSLKLEIQSNTNHDFETKKLKVLRKKIENYIKFD